MSFFTGRRATEASWKGRTAELLLENGERLQADLLLVATGVKARTDFLQGSGVKINEGIQVDGEMRTNCEHICRRRCCLGKGFSDR